MHTNVIVLDYLGVVLGGCVLGLVLEHLHLYLARHDGLLDGLAQLFPLVLVDADGLHFEDAQHGSVVAEVVVLALVVNGLTCQGIAAVLVVQKLLLVLWIPAEENTVRPCWYSVLGTRIILVAIGIESVSRKKGDWGLIKLVRYDCLIFAL